MKKNRTKLCSLILLLALLFSFSACGNGASAQNQSTLRAEFEDNGRDQPYSQGVPLTEMDFSVYEKYLSIGTGASKTNFDKINKMELPCDLEYYESKEDETPALILEKGTVIYLSPRDVEFPFGYGIYCWPDYEEGWRYGQPFKTSYSFYLEDDPKYYIKTDQLFTFVDEYMVLAYKDTPASLTKDVLDKGRKNLVFHLDIPLYTHGIFCSPDMEKYYAKREDIGVT